MSGAHAGNHGGCGPGTRQLLASSDLQMKLNSQRTGQGFVGETVQRAVFFHQSRTPVNERKPCLLASLWEQRATVQKFISKTPTASSSPAAGRWMLGFPRSYDTDLKIGLSIHIAYWLVVKNITAQKCPDALLMMDTFVRLTSIGFLLSILGFSILTMEVLIAAA